MLLFNGLYFRGNWAHPFMELRSEEASYFDAVSGKQEVKFMKSQGSFRYADVPSKNLFAIELPYEVRRKLRKKKASSNHQCFRTKDTRC